MKRTQLFFLCTLSFFLTAILVINGQTAKAAASEPSYAVSAEIPDNQINRKVSFFDLKVTPGSSQDLKFKIMNNSSTQHQYLVEVNRASTNSNGIIDYTQHGTKKDPDLKFDIEAMFPKPQKVTVAANSSQEVTLHMTTPNEAFTGMILGGIRVIQLNQISKTDNTKGKNLITKNQYAYIIGVQIQQNTDAVKPDLKLRQGVVEKNNGKTDIAAKLANDAPTIINQAEVKATVTPVNKSNKLIQMDKHNMQIAPETNFDLPVNTSDQVLKPGKYTMYIAANGDNGTQKWQMQKNFIITKSEFKKLQKTAAATPTSVNQPNYRLIISLAILGALIIIGLLIWNFKLQRRGRH